MRPGLLHSFTITNQTLPTILQSFQVTLTSAQESVDFRLDGWTFHSLVPHSFTILSIIIPNLSHSFASQ